MQYTLYDAKSDQTFCGDATTVLEKVMASAEVPDTCEMSVWQYATQIMCSPDNRGLPTTVLHWITGTFPGDVITQALFVLALTRTICLF